MQIIKPTVEYIDYGYSFEDQLKLAELVGRVSHASEDSITDESYKSFINRMLKMKHLSVLEFCQVTLRFQKDNPPMEIIEDFFKYIIPLFEHKYAKSSRELTPEGDFMFVYTNLRVLAELTKAQTLDNILEIYGDFISTSPYKTFDKHTFRINTSIGVAQQINRHRANSVLQRSTRYCNYSRDKFGSEISFIEPQWHSFENMENLEEAKGIWSQAMKEAENAYMKLIELGLKAEDARGVLPLDTATKLYHCSYKEDWEHFIELRSSSKAHPDTKFISDEIKKLLEN